MGMTTRDRAEDEPQFNAIAAFRGTEIAETSMAIDVCSMRGVDGTLRVILTFESPGKIRWVEFGAAFVQLAAPGKR